MSNQFVYKLRIHVEDTDYSGVVYHANYLNFMERARSEWFETLGLGRSWQHHHQIYFLVCKASLAYLKPIRLDERIEVITSIKRINFASIEFEQYLRPANDPAKILCRAEIKLACVDHAMRPRALPERPILDKIWRDQT